MGEVVDLNPKTQAAWWRCGCGCMTFYVRNDGELECAHCDGVVNGTGYWRLPENGKPPRREFEGETPPVMRVKAGDQDQALEGTLRFVKPEATAAVVVVQQSGAVHTWGDRFESRASRGWIRGRLETARRVLVGAKL